MEQNANLSETLERSLDEHRDKGSPGGGSLTASDDQAFVGDEVTLYGRGLPPNERVDVVWHTVDGRFAVLRANEVVGPQYSPRERQLRSLTTDGEGALETTLEVPEDYGGSHTVELRTADGGTVGRTEIEVRPWFELLEDTAPLGGFVTVRGYGIGPNPVQNNYQLVWDNGTVGILTGVENHGTATARVRAVGPVGTHTLEVGRSYRGVPFRQANTQSPFGPVGGDRDTVWQVDVTEPDTPIDPAWTEGMPEERPIDAHLVDTDRDTAASLAITPECGPPGTDAILTGTDLPPNETVDLVWYRHGGKRIEGSEIRPEPKPDLLPTVETDADGSFQEPITIPTDRGSTRPIAAEVDGDTLAVTGYMMQPTIRSFTPQSGPEGTEVTIELAGVGWTLYENVQFLVYDNKHLGYVCGNTDDDDHGVVRTTFRATGGPGHHFVDVYPTIFKLREDDDGFECKPHLSYLDNHPVRSLPAFHFAFEITE
jgi:hypothetical protein